MTTPLIIIGLVLLAFVGTVLKDKILKNKRKNVKEGQCGFCSVGKCKCFKTPCEGNCDCQ